MSTHMQSERGAVCGGGAGECTMHIVADRASVTCKRCLASLAKRDKAFWRKSAVSLRMGTEFCGNDWPRTWDSDARFYAVRNGTETADRAIAREEGRIQ